MQKLSISSSGQSLRLARDQTGKKSPLGEGTSGMSLSERLRQLAEEKKKKAPQASSPVYRDALPEPTYLGPTWALRKQVAERLRKVAKQYTIDLNGPRALRLEEARVNFVPVGETVQGVVEEVRPYGAFVALLLGSPEAGWRGEESGVRGFCPESELAVIKELDVGDKVAVKITAVDLGRQRVRVSALHAEPQWPETMVSQGLKLPGVAPDRETAGLISKSWSN